MSTTTKPLLRKRLLHERRHTPETTRAACSAQIVERLVQTIAWNTVHRLHCYIPIEKQCEVNVWPLLDYVWRYHPHIAVAIPGPLRADQPTAYLIHSDTTWHKTSAAPLPIEKELAPQGVFDLIIVPCLGFDKVRHRLGYGGGYYDRLLNAQTGAKTVGVAFWAGYIAEELPRESHDKALERIITERAVL